ncbi:hypothetical protein COO60DRAFT_1275691, partial [Scenedesmus sp. NREL 46B-D3]
PGPRCHWLVLAAVTATGLIWTRYSTQISPIIYNLMTVNAFMAVTGNYQLSRKIRYVRARSAMQRNGCKWLLGSRKNAQLRNV